MGTKPHASPSATRSAPRLALWIVAATLALVRFLWLTADFPNNSPWIIDQAKFTDEGWWANAAVMHTLTGHWHVPGDYNPAAALPIWPTLVGVLFHFTGVSLLAARALDVAISVATLAVGYALLRRCVQNPLAARVAVVLLAASPFAFAFSRLAILDTLVLFEFCLMLLVAAFTARNRIWPLPVLALLVSAALLTKTTSAVLIPAPAWLAWNGSGRGLRAVPPILLAAAVVPFVLVQAYLALAAHFGYGPDITTFYTVNAMAGMDWSQFPHWLGELARNGFLIDRLLYPLTLAILLASVTFVRRLWRNPLFSASWIALACQATFILRRQDDYAPRYFLVLLVPLVFVVVLAFDAALRSSRLAAGALAATMAAAVVLDSFAIAGFLRHREYRLTDAARQIGDIVRADPTRSPLLVGPSAAEVGLIARLPSINGTWGADDAGHTIARFRPGWYLAWNGEIDPAALRGYALLPVARYRFFDDDERVELTLYRIGESKDGHGTQESRGSVFRDFSATSRFLPSASQEERSPRSAAIFRQHLVGGMQQLLGLVPGWLAEEFCVELPDVRIVVGAAP